ncbi:MAG TPA: protein kinase [Victivallales bacterium]|nr:protein kinase [Victivallales bacterium]
MLGKKIICPNCNKNVLLPSSPFGVGRIIGDFIIEEKIGEGSIGIVYLAHQASLDRKVALKILSEEYANMKGKSAFLSEARAAARLSHPNLVKCLAVNEENGICYMAMNYIRGMTLKQKIKSSGKIEVDEALHITQQVAEALYYAWEEARLIHRDVKPENIMIDEDGIVQLTDLGLAMPETAWHEGMEISGSPSYMSPEQFTGEKLDTRSDIYSLGITLYQMLTGKLPFTGKTLNTVARQHFKDIAVPVNRIIPTIPKGVSELVARMIAKHPDDRFKNMDELLHEIWKIRQTTAPEKELIPSVHTVTLKKLDYDLQNQAKARKIQIQIEEKEEKNKSELLLKIFAFAVPVIVLLVIFLIAISTQKKNIDQTAVRIVENIEQMIDEGDHSVGVLDAELQKAKNSIASLKNIQDGSIEYRIKLCEQKIINLKLQQRNKVLETQVDSLAMRINDMENKIYDNADKNSEIEEKNKKIKELEARLQSLIRELKREKDYSGTLRKTIDKINELNFANWADDLRVKTAFMIRNNRFQEAYAILKTSVVDPSPAQSNWLADKIKEVENIEKLFNSIENSALRYEGIEVKEGKIKEIIGGTVSLISTLGVIENIPWKNLSFESIEKIIPPEIKNYNRENLPYYIALLTGKFSEAQSVFSKNPEAKKTMLAVRKYIYDSIRFLAETDKKRAISRADDFMRDFSSTEGFDTMKKELEQMLK